MAVPTLRFIVDGGAPIDCADGDACDLNGVAGAVTVNDSLGVLTVNVTTGVTKPVFAGSHMDLNSIMVQTTGGGHTIDILFSEIDYSLLIGAVADFGGTLSGSPGGSITASAYFDESNALFGLASPIGTTGPLGGGAFAASFTGPGPSAAPYSLTQVLTLVTTGATNFSGNFELQLVPEPASVALLGGVLLVTAGIVRKRFRPAAK
jgi:hypothetical protein